MPILEALPNASSLFQSPQTRCVRAVARATVLRYLFDPRPPLALRPLRQLRLCAQPDLARNCCELAEVVRDVTRGWLLIGGVVGGGI